MNGQSAAVIAADHRPTLSYACPAGIAANSRTRLSWVAVVLFTVSLATPAMVIVYRDRTEINTWGYEVAFGALVSFDALSRETLFALLAPLANALFVASTAFLVSSGRSLRVYQYRTVARVLASVALRLAVPGLLLFLFVCAFQNGRGGGSHTRPSIAVVLWTAAYICLSFATVWRRGERHQTIKT